MPVSGHDRYTCYFPECRSEYVQHPERCKSDKRYGERTYEHKLPKLGAVKVE